MRLDEILKKALQYFGWLAIAFQDGPTSPQTLAIKVLNVTGTTNSSSAGNGTLFNAAEISNFIITNATTTFASPVTLPRSLLPLFESATDASELQSALSTIFIQISTSPVPESRGTPDRTSTASTTSRDAIDQATTTGPSVTITTPNTFSSLPSPLSSTISTSPQLLEASATLLAHANHSKSTESRSTTALSDNTFFKSLPSSMTSQRITVLPSTGTFTANETHMVSGPSYSLALLGPLNSTYLLKHAFNFSLTTLGGIGNYSGKSRPLASMLGDSLNFSPGHGLICKEVKSQNCASYRISESAKSPFATFEDSRTTDNLISRDDLKEHCEDDTPFSVSPAGVKSMKANGIATNETGLVSSGTAPAANGTNHMDWKFINFKAYFTLLNDQSLFKDDQDVPDEDYFELTPENLRDSLMEQWYSSWTVVAQNKPAWKKYGEWGAFWREYLHEPNFKCPSGFASCNYQPPSVQEIRRMFPNNRVLGRRVLFTSLIYEIMHAHTNEQDALFKDTEVRFQTLIPNIIEVFTLQVDPDKAENCQYIKQMVVSAITVVMDAAIAVVTDGIGQVVTSKLQDLIENQVFNKYLDHLDPISAYDFSLKKPMAQGYAKDWGPLAKHTANQGSIFPLFHIPQQWGANFYHPGTFWGKDIAGANDPPEWHNERENGAPADAPYTADDADTTYLAKHSLFNEAYRAWPWKKLEEIKSEQADSDHYGTMESALPTITSGTGSGWVCSEFEGDWQDHNEDNNRMLRNRVAVELEAARRQVWKLFMDMYDGELIEPGRPSLLARWMVARNWIGKDKKGSVEYDLYHIEDFHKKFELVYVKDLASSALASGHNYLKCSHREDAAEKCANDGLEYQQLYCPEPETDPTMVCQAGKWYFSNTEPHEIDMVAINTIEKFGAMHGFAFSRNKMLAEIWDNWKEFGNRPQERKWGKEALRGPYHERKHPHGFRLPVCVSEDNEYDVHHHQLSWWKKWNFPATCGNHAANETADFMKAMNLGPGSPKHSNTDWTFRDRIPRALWNKAPYTVYMSMCEMGLRWPNKDHDDIHWDNRYTLKTSKDETDNTRGCGEKGFPACPEGYEDRAWGDQDCALVKYKTRYMDELEANLAFCANTLGHTIFHREAPHIWTGLVPLNHWRNNEYQCGKWLGQKGMKALETVSRRTLDAAEKGTPPPVHVHRTYGDKPDLQP